MAKAVHSRRVKTTALLTELETYKKSLIYECVAGKKEVEKVECTKEVNNIAEYVQCIQQLKPYLYSQFGIRDDILLFRGQPNETYELMPGIGRNKLGIHERGCFLDERNLIEMAKYKLPDIFRNELAPLELLALLQHHGIPTRLLDVTESALVALFFACGGDEKADGEVFAFKSSNRNVVTYPVVQAIADSYRFIGPALPLAAFYAAVKNQPYFAEEKHILQIYHQDDVAGGKWIGECCQTPFYVYAPLRSIRQQVQHGRYILFPNEISTEKCEDGYFIRNINPMPKDHPDIVARIIVPGSIKQELLQELRLFGITKSFLFCDNVDNVCQGVVDSFAVPY